MDRSLGMVSIITSLDDDFAYYDNLGYLRNGVAKGTIAFQGFVNFAPPAYVFNSNRPYDFIRKAKADVTNAMVNFLYRELPGLQYVPPDNLRGVFDGLFNYFRYKECLLVVGQPRYESMKMLVFNHQQQYVAHIQFSSTTTRNHPNLFTVNATLTCQCFTYFPLKQTNIAHVLAALESLHV